MTAFIQPFSLTAGVPNTTFTVANGLIRSPGGANYIARGINVYESAQGSVITNSACQPLTTLFSKINFIRLVAFSYNPPSFYQTFISRATALNIVVEIEHHSGAGGGVAPLTGQALIDESNWFASLATAFKSNPYVWFGSLNEPGPPGQDVTAEQVSNYNAIRGTGNTSPILMETLGDYSTGILVIGSGHGLQPDSAYANMTNIVWDTHIYNGLPHFQVGDGKSYSTNQAQLNTMVAGYIQQSQTIRSADGVVPVIIGEYGISTSDGSDPNFPNGDPGGTQTCIAVQQSGVGCAAWNWQSGTGLPDCLTDGNNNLTTYGQQVAGWINSVPTTTRNWYDNPGMDGSFWVTPFYNSAQWTTTGQIITVLRNGTFGSPRGVINMVGNFSAPWYVGRASDPVVTVTNGSKSIQVHLPLGAVAEGPSSSVDQSIGGADMTQPYLVWSISGASLNTGSVQASGTVITGTYGMQIDDGAGEIMTDRVTGQPGTNNSIGNLLDYELTQARLDPNYVIRHMLNFQMDPRQAAPGTAGTLAWPLAVGDGGATYTGIIPQGITIGIPATTVRPTGKTRGFYLLFDNLQQFGWFNYNFGGAGCTFITCYSTLSANSSLATDCANSISEVMGYVCILSNQTGPSSAKGFVSGATLAFPAPPPLDLSPSGGKNVLPSTFGAWYPSGYNALPTNT